MRSIRRTLAILALAAGAAACDDDESTGPTPTARLRFLHAMPATAAVGVTWGGESILSSAAYGAGGAAYQNVRSGQRSLAARASGAASDAAAKTLTLEKDRAYTALLVKSGSAGDLALLADTNAAPASGKAKVRAVHAAASVTGNVDVYVTAPSADISNLAASASGVAPGKAAKYLEVDAGTYQVRFTNAGAKTVVLDAGSVTLAAGQIRTVAALDADNGGTPLKAVTLQDRNP